MKKNLEKPLPEAKALSLFLMAHKATSPSHKENARRINKLWEAVKADDISKSEYMEAVNEMLSSYGGYEEVIENTVKFYIEKTGEWKLQGDDKYSLDTQEVANRILKK